MPSILNSAVSRASRGVVEGLEQRRLLAADPIYDVKDLGRLEAHEDATLTQVVGARNPADTYGFVLNEATQINISLSKLSADANIVLKKGRELMCAFDQPHLQ